MFVEHWQWFAINSIEENIKNQNLFASVLRINIDLEGLKMTIFSCYPDFHHESVESF